MNQAVQPQSDSDQRWFPHVTVACIAVRDGKYLMVRETDQGVSVLNQPAGHVEQGESLESAVIRETLEETGWEFEPCYLSGIYHFVAANGETYIRFTFFGELVRHRPGVKLDPAIEGIEWIARSELQNGELNLRNDVVVKCICDYEAGNRLPPNSVQQLKSAP